MIFTCGILKPTKTTHKLKLYRGPFHNPFYTCVIDNKLMPPRFTSDTEYLCLGSSSTVYSFRKKKDQSARETVFFIMS